MQKKLLSYLLIATIISSCSKDLQNTSISKDSNNDSVNSSAKNPNELSRKIIYFDTNSSKISQESIDQTRKDVKAIIGKNSKITISVEGHCDERGAEQYNYKLGKRRAHAIKKLLVKFGIKPSRIAVVSYGENKPVDLGHDENAWSKNRRVEVIISK